MKLLDLRTNDNSINWMFKQDKNIFRSGVKYDAMTDYKPLSVLFFLTKYAITIDITDMMRNRPNTKGQIRVIKFTDVCLLWVCGTPG